MGVNKVREGITDYEVVEEAARQEIIRRYFRYKKEYILGLVGKEVVDEIEKILNFADLSETERSVVIPARECAKLNKEGNKGVFCGSAIDLKGKIICGKNSELLHSESACIINALKKLANIPQKINIFPRSVIDSIRMLKQKINLNSNPSLDVSEILIALAISASINPSAQECLDKLPMLRGAEMHVTHLPTKGDEVGLREIGINLTTDGELSGKIYLIE
jgi:uncharacterized protein (UPF0371 family)